MKVASWFFMSLFILSMVSCFDDEETVTPTSPTHEKCQAIFIDDYGLNIGDFYNLDSLHIEDDCLTVKVGYSGGCKTHDFELRTQGAIVETSPLTADIVLWHNAHNDNCEAYILEELHFDLKDLQLDDNEVINLYFITHDKAILYNY